jgi:hypothetical protein
MAAGGKVENMKDENISAKIVCAPNPLFGALRISFLTLSGLEPSPLRKKERGGANTTCRSVESSSYSHELRR